MSIFNPTKFLLFVTVLAGVLLFQSCKDDSTAPAKVNASQYDSGVFLRWNQTFTEIERNARGYRPGPAPRALAYLGLSAYESIVAGIPENNSMKNLYPGLDIPDADANQVYYWPACVNESYAYLMKRFFFHMESEFPDQYQKIEQLRLQLHDEYAAKASAEVLERSELFGQAVAQAVYEWETSDAIGHNAFLNPQPETYTPPSGPGLWQPTFPDFGRAVYPYWGQVRTFAITAPDKICNPPIPYSESTQSLFYSQAMQAYNYVNTIKNPAPGEEDLAYEGRWIGEFWSDDILFLTFSPPTRLIAITNQVVELENTNLATAAELYAKLGMALHDDGVATWNSKYIYNVERPVSYIRRVVSKQYPAAANWTTILDNPYSGFDGVTPAFPAYPSGHSGFAGAGAKILSSFYEYNSKHPGAYTFTDNCHINRTEFNGTPRTFHSFAQLAKEDADSRVPLGVHFQMDCDEGVRVGETAAQRVLDLPWKK